MTDNEIIKALECCCRENCNGCPYRDGKCHQGNPMIRDALDLINRQKAKIEALQMDNKQLETDNFNANMNLEHLQTEIERLKAESEKHSDECLSCYALTADTKQMHTAVITQWLIKNGMKWRQRKNEMQRMWSRYVFG